MENHQNQARSNIPSPNDENQYGLTPDSQALFLEIHVRGQLDRKWSEWLEGLQMKPLENDEMLLSGPVVDQAALMGLLTKLSRLNLTLLSVNVRQTKNPYVDNR
jgi:hypothetical protein